MNWLAEDPPTWNWKHDPEYRSLRARRILQGCADAWNAFVNDPETRFRRFCNTGAYEPRGPRSAWS